MHVYLNETKNMAIETLENTEFIIFLPDLKIIKADWSMGIKAWLIKNPIAH